MIRDPEAYLAGTLRKMGKGSSLKRAAAIGRARKKRGETKKSLKAGHGLTWKKAIEMIRHGRPDRAIRLAGASGPKGKRRVLWEA